MTQEELNEAASNEVVAEVPTEAGSEETSISKLEEEGDIAADYLEELLDIFDLDGDIDIDVRQGRAYVAIQSSEDSNLRLISEPDTVEALQELTRLAVQVKTNNFSRLILDIGGSREAKISQLAKVVDRAIAKAKETGSNVPLKPMSSYERKLAHDMIAEAGLVSESDGEGKERHIVIKPA
ncbi:MAG: protein jag [Micrococcales bacterium]